MNSQFPMHPTYTLPGIMHYLQTEFTKNERDRISWELERSEMKARIAHLEGENKDLRYRLMKLDPNPEPEILRTLDKSDTSPLIKSKAAVQENVKEIIYLFKSPNLGSQMETLNEKKDPVHELEKMGFNQSRDNQSQPLVDNDNAEHQRIDLHQVDSLQEVTQHEDLGGAEIDERSDAGTVVVGSENEQQEAEESSDFTKRHRSSSLFTSEKVQPLDAKEEQPQEERVSLVQGSTDRSAIVRLKVHGNKVIAYSKSGELSQRFVNKSLDWENDQYHKYEGLSSELLDIFWVDNEKFLTLDNEGIKLRKTTVEDHPIAALKLFGENLQFNQVNAWDFKNSWLLLALKGRIYLKEISISPDSSKISIGKSYYFNTNKKVWDAKFGMTEKSLIVLNRNPDELVIYSFQGKQLQKIDIRKHLSKNIASDSDAMLYLNKKSSKLLILIQELLLIYSFDQKKIILKQSLRSQPTSVIFNSPKDYVALAYDDGYIELRNIKDFNSVIKRYNHVNDEVELDENTQSLMDSGLRPMDRNPIVLQDTEIDNHKVIISADNSGRMKLNEIQELGEN
ncbi:hypothetical protein ZYGR_0P02620 [Zygosaccharomyces rouxii]|uniref:ZYRO0E06688p n=2 Tax=Zygosaccharomyces rouxii TaxID=4956 RepID=C5E4J7_ZYGRC|nr:uncharacterized protein ZYRO0E06688g [Zygosaccharomyces rouxii]KAH9198185.1 Striatin family-domain-containing protein [Zygosaccharomyces rouxii]GAV49617.1 hypothetical protein ZYGR_0P02620 [Zygosaccharomyces rouxii]CAR30958.1 ZYRO0E06688p [Zygosaccharomyces rouxii]